LADDLGAAAVATAHHRDDVAEGVLVQLLRGGGPRALSGIADRTALGVIRPLLPWSRTELRSWLEDRSIQWREDSSNRSLDHLRNRVRHQFVPAMEEASPALREHLVELAGALASSEAYLGEELRRQAQWIDPWEPDGGVEVALLRNLRPALRGRWLHAQADRIGLDRVSRRQLQLFERLLDQGSPRSVTLGRRWTLRAARGLLWLEPPARVAPYAFDLVLGKEQQLPMAGWSVRLAEHESSGSRWSLQVRPGARIHLRCFRSGDRLEGAAGPVPAARKLAESLPRHLRRTWPVFCEDDRICWIPGVWERPEGHHPGGHVVEVMRRERPASGL
jgi:tRNA(Ile)-lysidine synthase